MSHAAYEVLHLFGVLFLFMSLGGAAFHSATGGTRATNSNAKLIAATHGAALVVILVAGFGAAGKGGLMGAGMPTWIYGKLAIWFLFGAVIVILNRVPGSGRWLWFLLPALGAVSAWLAIVKPF